MRQIDRALLAAYFMEQNRVINQEMGMTAHSLSRYMGCHPQTVTDCLFRYGKAIGVGRVEDVVDGKVKRRLWFVSDEEQWKNVMQQARVVYMQNVVETMQRLGYDVQ